MEAIRNMKGNRGRMITQGGHGILHAFWDAQRRFPDDALAYMNQSSAFKITKVVDNGDALRLLAVKYKDVCGISLVEEKGTRADGSVNVEVQDVTCLGIGPIRNDLIGEDIINLKLFL
jgi:peptidyl-tRNA hydrolase